MMMEHLPGFESKLQKTPDQPPTDSICSLYARISMSTSSSAKATLSSRIWLSGIVEAKTNELSDLLTMPIPPNGLARAFLHNRLGNRQAIRLSEE
jgi:hypothetical protein